jgi:gamma-glutamylcyclotransferase (GGCT)/AIG2-like uncharacterized protein YtfP
MSHTLDIETEIHDLTALSAACNRLNIKMETGQHRLFNTTETGTAVFLEGWRYPAVIKEGGKVAFDNYEGSWGDMARLNELKAYYGLEKSKIEARKKGYSVYESRNDQTRKLELKIRL